MAQINPANAIDLAACLLTTAEQQQTAREETHSAKIARLMEDPLGKAMTMALADQAFRSQRQPTLPINSNILLISMVFPTIFPPGNKLACIWGR